MNFKIGDIVVVLEDEKIGINEVIFFKAGEVCKVCNFHAFNKNRIQLQSLNPSYSHGQWFTDASNVDYALEIFQVLS
jgi:hypothetical protein